MGSIACVAGSTAVSLLLLLYFQWCDTMLQLTDQLTLLQGCMLASLAAAAVESLPLPDADNMLVPAVAAAVGVLWFGLSP